VYINWKIAVSKWQGRLISLIHGYSFPTSFTWRITARKEVKPLVRLGARAKRRRRRRRTEAEGGGGGQSYNEQNAVNRHIHWERKWRREENSATNNKANMTLFLILERRPPIKLTDLSIWWRRSNARTADLRHYSGVCRNGLLGQCFERLSYSFIHFVLCLLIAFLLYSTSNGSITKVYITVWWNSRLRKWAELMEKLNNKNIKKGQGCKWCQSCW
jgi:hypothetical protein